MKEYQVIGISALVVARDTSEILTVVENGSDTQSAKVAGERGIIHEKSRVGEAYEDTLEAALIEEVLGYDGVEKEAGRLHRVSGMPDIPLTSLPGRGGKIEVVVYDGQPKRLLDYAPIDDEVSLGCLVDPYEFLFQQPTRQVSQEAVRYALGFDLLARGLRTYERGGAIPLFRRLEDPKSFIQQRREKKDSAHLIAA